MDITCPECKCSMLQTTYATMVCPLCGLEDFKVLILTECSYTPYTVPLRCIVNYTRMKRFRKYLNRAAMQQSANSVPKATWDYLLPNMPFQSPRAIIRSLKAAPKTIGKKCYDCLPFLVTHLCPHLNVPHLSYEDQEHAMREFQILDRAYSNGEAFISYLFVLEYILKLIGRADMLPFINKISCRKRRAAYQTRMNTIYQK